MKIYTLASGTIYEGDWMEAPLEGGYDMAEVDGPYGLRKAAWDMMKIDKLAEWYRPHLTRLTSLMALSSSVYLWNTAEGWARIDPEMRVLGWSYESLIVWDKRTGPSVINNQKASGWPDVTEVCCMYSRGTPFFSNKDRLTNIWPLSSVAFADEKERHPTEKLKAAHGLEWAAPLHVSQKPLLFAERMVQASTRPGARILIPFGGTCRIATYLERLKRMEPESARYYDCCELNADGKDYLGAVLGRMDEDAAAKSGQIPLFGVRR